MASHPGTVTFKASNGLELRMLLGEQSPAVADGVSTYDTVSRPKRESVTRYTGWLPYKQDIDVVFDGYANDESQEADISTLHHMSRGDITIKLSGQALHKAFTWRISGIDWDRQNTLWIIKNGLPHRTRQFATIHLLEAVDDTVLKTPSSPSVKKKDPTKTKHITTPAGMTIKQIATVVFGDPDRWMDVVTDNFFLPADPRYFVPAGTVLVFLAVPAEVAGFVVP